MTVPDPGSLITFEGGDGVGKSTLQMGLATRLRELGREVISTREPGGCALGEAIREVLLHTHGVPVCPRAELLLYLAARAQHVEEQILPAIHAGVMVLCDRYHDSSMVYQGFGRGLALPEIESICAFAGQGLVPTLTFLLDLSPKQAAARREGGRLDRIESESESFHEKVRQGFLQLAKESPERFEILDASRPPQVLLEQAWTRLQILL